MNASASRWCVLIPCLNEEAAIGRVINSVLALNLPVIVVDRPPPPPGVPNAASADEIFRVLSADFAGTLRRRAAAPPIKGT